MTQEAWIAVSVVVAIGAAIAVSGFVGKRTKRQAKPEKPTIVYMPELDLSTEGRRRILTMDGAETMPVGKNQIDYSVRRALRKYDKAQELGAEGIHPDMKIINKGLRAIAKREGAKKT